MPIAAGFAAFYTWLVGVIGARTALLVFAVGTVVSCTAALLVIIKASVSALAAAAAIGSSGLPSAFVMAFWAILPANIETIIALMLSGDAAVFACRYHLQLVKIMAQ